MDLILCESISNELTLFSTLPSKKYNQKRKEKNNIYFDYSLFHQRIQILLSIIALYRINRKSLIELSGKKYNYNERERESPLVASGNYEWQRDIL